MNEVSTLAAVAKFFDVRASTVTNWKNRGCSALQGLGPYDLDAVGDWRLHLAKHDKKPKPEAPEPQNDSLALRKLKADVKSAEMKAELEAYKVAIKTGRLIDARDIEEITQKQSQAFRTELMAIPKTQAIQFVQIETVEQAEAKLRALVFAVLSRLSLKEKAT